jgi:hypothetical protein
MSNLDCVGIGHEGMISSLSTFAWRLHGKSPFQHHAFPSVQVLISRPPFTGLLPFKFSMFIDEITLNILHWINPSLAILLLFRGPRSARLRPKRTHSHTYLTLAYSNLDKYDAF